MSETYEHKRGDSFYLLVTIPPQFANGYFVGHTVASQIRQPGADGAMVAELVCTWVDALTTRALRLQCMDTKAWPVGPAQFDVQFTRTVDDFVFSSTTEQFFIVPDVTQVVTP